MVHIVVILFLYSTLMLFSDGAYARENCVFEKSSFSEMKYKKNTDIKSIVWEAKDSVAKIMTKEGELVSVQHWACDHLGLQAVMLLNAIEMSEKKIIINKIQVMVKLFLNVADHVIVNSTVESAKCLEKNICRINIPVENYAEFYIETERQQESMTILLKYYMN